MANSEKYNERTLRNLFSLHGDRVLGDIPIHPSNNIDPVDIVQAASRTEDLGSLLSPDSDKKDHDTMLGTVYVYDRKRLQRMLNENKEMLDKAEWPRQADKFIEYLSWVTAPKNTDIYDFIARLHDPNGRNPALRRDVHEKDEWVVENQRKFAYWQKMKFHALKRNDAAAAQKIIEDAKTGQNIPTMVYASRLYARGGGVPQDYAESAFWAGVVARRTIPMWRGMIEEKHPNVENLMGRGIKATDSDAAISTAVAEHTQFQDYVKLRDAAMSHLTSEQRAAVEKRIEEWRPASQQAPAPVKAPSASFPPGFRVWK